jgi:hypothetical protein
MKKLSLFLIALFLTAHLFATVPNRADVGSIERDGQQIASLSVTPTGTIFFRFFDRHFSLLPREVPQFEKALQKGLELIETVNRNNITVAYRRSLGYIQVSSRGGRISFIFTNNYPQGTPPVLHGTISPDAGATLNPVSWNLRENEIRTLLQLIDNARKKQGDLSNEITLLDNLFENWSLF